MRPFVMLILSIAAALLLPGCAEQAPPPPEAAPVVLTADAVPSDGRHLQLSGTLRSRFETPLAFQVAGRVLARELDGGQPVRAGQRIARLDPADLEQALARTQADADAARAALRRAEADLARHRELKERGFVSAQLLEQVELTDATLREQLRAADAGLAQARNALGYAELRAPHDGLLIEVSAEPGQVLGIGQPAALLARDDALEVEVLLPEAIGFPNSARIETSAGQIHTLILRERSGAADPQTRGWRARYAFDEAPAGLGARLGSILMIELDLGGAGAALRVPVSAVHDRGQGPQLWLVVDGRAQPHPVQVLAMDTHEAQVSAPALPAAPVIIAGLHRLQPGMAVRTAAR